MRVHFQWDRIGPEDTREIACPNLAEAPLALPFCSSVPTPAWNSTVRSQVSHMPSLPTHTRSINRRKQLTVARTIFRQYLFRPVPQVPGLRRDHRDWRRMSVDFQCAACSERWCIL